MRYNNFLQDFKSDIKAAYLLFRFIPSMDALRLKYKSYNPIIKLFLPFLYIQIPLLQLVVILSVSYLLYTCTVHFSSDMLGPTLIGIMCWSFYITSVRLFLNKYVNLSNKHNKALELLSILILFVFLCFSILCFGTRWIILLLILFMLIKHYIKYYSNSFNLPNRLSENVVVKTLSSRNDRINNLFNNQMFISGFYNQFVTSQYLLIVAYYLTHENSYECHLLMQYGIWHICFNLINRAIAASFGNPRGVVVSKVIDNTASLVAIGAGIGGMVGCFVTDSNNCTRESGNVSQSVFGQNMTLRHQNSGGYLFNYNDIVSRNFAEAAKNSSSEFNKYLINSQGGLCSENAIGSQDRIIDSAKTDQCLSQNNIEIVTSEFGVKRFAVKKPVILDQTSTFGQLMSKDLSKK